jgi:hypothetical protein
VWAKRAVGRVRALATRRFTTTLRSLWHPQDQGSTVIGPLQIGEADIDYDSPRRPPVEDDGGLDELRVRSNAAQSSGADLDEMEAAEGFELSGVDPSGEELTVPVMPMRYDEWRCTRCYLVQHRNQFIARSDGQDVCRECS